ncbi:MAG: Na/Pi cotransporter family protein [Oscillibacter sp.]|nr:Na/Pi cotransporter family protein [Oscillibacter sp.]
MLGAIAVLMFGMSTMTDGLEKLSSGRLERLLEHLTDNVFKGVLFGAVVTGLIQSSTATTVMCVAFVNAGVMKLEQTVGIIMGANIGTTVTAQLLSLGDISTDNPFLMMLKPAVLGGILAVLGIIFYLFINGGGKRFFGQILLGMGLLFIGMSSMETAMAPMQSSSAFQQMFASFSNPVLGVIVGALVTALLHSSAASVGILQALSATGVISFNIAFPLIMGQNIGTCLTSLVSSVGASKNAKRTAALHLIFNITGTLIFLVVLYGGNALFHFSFWEAIMDRGAIANLHLTFNISCTVILLPFHKQLVKLVERVTPGGEGEISMLDERFLATPSLALERAESMVMQMGASAQENIQIAVELLERFDLKKLERLNETEATLDKMEGLLDSYLVKLTDRTLSQEESSKVSVLLHTLSDFERMGDYAVNVSECAVVLNDRNLSFSPRAKKELDVLTRAVEETVEKTLQCYRTHQWSDALQVEPMEEVVDVLAAELKDWHVERLKDGKCTIELGTQFLELLINLERISDHCSNVALNVLRELSSKSDLVWTDSHDYMRQLHHGADPVFDQLFQEYRERYFRDLEEA